MSHTLTYSYCQPSVAGNMDPLLDCLFEVEDMDISCLTESPLEIESLRGPQTDDEHSLSRGWSVY